MKSKAAIAGHPIHPMLVPIPIGLFVWSLVSFIIYAASDNNRMWYDISYWSAIAGIVGALIAGLFGAVDGFGRARESDSRETAMTHMTLNMIVSVLFIAAILFMRDGGALDGRDMGIVLALQAVAVVLLSYSGWLGGEMVYRNHMAVIPEDGEVAAAEERRHGRQARAGDAMR